MEEGNQEKNSIKMKRTRSITVNTRNKNPEFLQTENSGH